MAHSVKLDIPSSAGGAGVDLKRCDIAAEVPPTFDIHVLAEASTPVAHVVSGCTALVADVEAGLATDLIDRGIHTLAGSISLHPQVDAATAAAALFVSLCSRCNDKSRKLLIADGCCEALLAALERHAASTALARDVCRSLAWLACGTDSQEALLSMGAGAAVVVVLHRHMANADAAAAACDAVAALGAAASSSAGAAARLRDAGACTALLATMRHHHSIVELAYEASGWKSREAARSNIEVLHSAVSAVTRLAAAESLFAQLLALDVAAAIAECTERWSPRPDGILACCLLFRRILALPDGSEILHRAGAAVCVRSLSGCACDDGQRDEELAATVLELLCAVAAAHPDDCAEIAAKGNGVYTARGALRVYAGCERVAAAAFALMLQLSMKTERSHVHYLAADMIHAIDACPKFIPSSYQALELLMTRYSVLAEVWLKPGCVMEVVLKHIADSLLKCTDADADRVSGLNRLILALPRGWKHEQRISDAGVVSALIGAVARLSPQVGERCCTGLEFVFQRALSSMSEDCIRAEELQLLCTAVARLPHRSYDQVRTIACMLRDSLAHCGTFADPAAARTVGLSLLELLRRDDPSSGDGPSLPDDFVTGAALQALSSLASSNPRLAALLNAHGAGPAVVRTMAQFADSAPAGASAIASLAQAPEWCGDLLRCGAASALPRLAARSWHSSAFFERACVAFGRLAAGSAAGVPSPTDSFARIDVNTLLQFLQRGHGAGNANERLCSAAWAALTHVALASSGFKAVAGTAASVACLIASPEFLLHCLSLTSRFCDARLTRIGSRAVLLCELCASHWIAGSESCTSTVGSDAAAVAVLQTTIATRIKMDLLECGANMGLLDRDANEALLMRYSLRGDAAAIATTLASLSVDAAAVTTEAPADKTTVAAAAVSSASSEPPVFAPDVDELSASQLWADAVVYAAQSGIIAAVDTLLRHPPAGTPQNVGAALRIAASRGDAAMVDHLIDTWHAGSSPESSDAEAALWAGAGGGHLEIVQCLVARCGVDPTGGSNAALAQAAMHGHIPVFGWLLDQEKAVSPVLLLSALRHACREGHAALAALLLQDCRLHLLHDPDVDHHDAELGSGKDGGSEDGSSSSARLLHDAAAAGHVGVVQLLLEDPRVSRSRCEACMASSPGRYGAPIARLLMRQPEFLRVCLLSHKLPTGAAAAKATAGAEAGAGAAATTDAPASSVPCHHYSLEDVHAWAAAGWQRRRHAVLSRVNVRTCPTDSNE